MCFQIPASLAKTTETWAPIFFITATFTAISLAAFLATFMVFPQDPDVAGIFAVEVAFFLLVSLA
jgi:hypothetical protein